MGFRPFESLNLMAEERACMATRDSSGADIARVEASFAA